MARYLQINDLSRRTLVIAPPIVHDKWEEQLKIKDINHTIFSTAIPFTASTGKTNHQITKLEKELERADKNTVILIDEAHYYRNQRTNERLHKRASRVYALFIPAVNRGAKIFLLTATAYGTNIHNLNGLLHLLPHRSNKPTLFSTQGPWEVQKPEEFVNLPVVTILGLPHVLSLARQIGHVDEDGRTYIRYGSKKVYLPKTMQLKPVPYKLFLDQSISVAYNDGFFAQAGKFTTRYIDESTGEIIEGVVDILNRIALISWLSSPEALLEVITYNLRTSDPSTKTNQTSIFSNMNSDGVTSEKDVIDTNEKRYNVSLLRSQLERRKLLGKIQDELKEVDDDKFACLKKIIDEQFLKNGSKVLIFIRRYPTASYLLRRLRQVYSTQVTVGCMIEQDDKGTNRLKKSADRHSDLKDFSSSDHKDNRLAKAIDVLICTDADSLGIDLPGVNTIINYDSPEGADILFQRAGRIMRMTENPERTVYFYTLIPSVYNEPAILSRCRTSIKKRFDRLVDRHEKSTQIIGTDVLSDNQELNVLLDSTIDVEKFTRDDDVLDSIGGLGSKSMLTHSMTLDKYRDRSQSLRDFLHSAVMYDGVDKKLFLLLNYAEKYYPILYNVKSEEVELLSETRILNTISCVESAPRALVSVSEIEKTCCVAAEKWREQHSIIGSLKLEKVCALLLVPKSLQKDAIINEFVGYITN